MHMEDHIPPSSEQRYPLSPLQQGMLFHALYAPGAGVDIEQMVCTLGEEVDADLLERCWRRVAARHDILRTAFRWRGEEEPVQEVAPRVELEFTREDLSALPGDAREARLGAF